jgi:hypothetical protein
MASPSAGPNERNRPSSAARKAKNPMMTVAAEAPITGPTALVAFWIPARIPPGSRRFSRTREITKRQ